MNENKKQWKYLFGSLSLDQIIIVNETHEELFKQIGHDYTVTVCIYTLWVHKP